MKLKKMSPSDSYRIDGLIAPNPVVLNVTFAEVSVRSVARVGPVPIW